jgi:7-carboxy-7-deazaguanine synthase
LRVNEIFHSLQGEADCVGFPTVFVRLTGCPLRCQYCDTEYAFHAGDWFDLESIVEKVQAFGTAHDRCQNAGIERGVAQQDREFSSSDIP